MDLQGLKSTGGGWAGGEALCGREQQVRRAVQPMMTDLRKPVSERAEPSSAD
ncbi:hypothetical protein [Ruminococcus sp.]|uniref:hypothetical protein n=1 Tax=Ruminococcus sp. TaxID=41978 RepID=UPI0025EF6D77|nr:hypothetical protein [Ruminococcus sp.]MBQ8965109.1 hypothetical protein [Ruminococcus sp.]